MSRNLCNPWLSKIKKESMENEITKPSIWFQTAAGEIVELEYELGWQSPLICEKLKFGVGSTRSSPIYLGPKVKAQALELIFDYFRFHQATGHSDKECKLFVDGFLKKDTNTLCMLVHASKCLQLEELLHMICRALARNIENSSLEVKQEFATLCEKSVEGEWLNLQENLDGDLCFRFARKLLAKQKKKLGAVENVKKADVEVEAQEDRSINDLLSFINGGDGDAKGVQTSKKKKKNRNRGKEKKKTSSSSALFSTEPNEVINNHEQDMNAANHGGSVAESFNVEGDDVDDDMDPALMEKIDRLAC